MRIYKLISLLLVTVLALSIFAACSAETEESTAAPTQPSQQADAYGENDVTVLSDYAVLMASPEDENMQAVVAVDAAGEPVLTNRDLQILYWLEFYDFMNYYGDYASYFGLDFNTPLAQQSSLSENLTWEQYYLESAQNHFAENYALAQTAYANGYTLDEEDAANVAAVASTEGAFAEEAKNAGYESNLAYIQASFGAGCDIPAYQDYLKTYFAAYDYYNEQSALIENDISDEDIQAYYDAKEADYVESRLLDVNNVTVRHILIEPAKDEEGNVVENGMEDALAQIQAVQAEWETDPTEEHFAELVPTYSADPGSLETGGLYEDFGTNEMVAEFSDWCFDQSRQPGDVDIVETEYGYHLIYFVEQTETQGWKDTVRDDMVLEEMDKIVKAAMENHPVRFDFSKVRIFDMITYSIAATEE